MLGVVSDEDCNKHNGSVVSLRFGCLDCGPSGVVWLLPSNAALCLYRSGLLVSYMNESILGDRLYYCTTIENTLLQNNVFTQTCVRVFRDMVQGLTARVF